MACCCTIISLSIVCILCGISIGFKPERTALTFRLLGLSLITITISLNVSINSSKVKVTLVVSLAITLMSLVCFFKPSASIVMVCKPTGKFSNWKLPFKSVLETDAFLPSLIETPESGYPSIEIIFPSIAPVSCALQPSAVVNTKIRL